MSLMLWFLLVYLIFALICIAYYATQWLKKEQRYQDKLNAMYQRHHRELRALAEYSIVVDRYLRGRVTLAEADRAYWRYRDVIEGRK